MRWQISIRLALWLWALGAAAGAQAATAYYVTPTGTLANSGTSWATAWSNVQTAVSAATNAGDAVYLRWGVYSNASQVAISNAAGVTIVGGCHGWAGEGSNAYSGTNSTLTRVAGVETRIVYGESSTVRVENVTFSGGYFEPGGGTSTKGAGLFLTNCESFLTNCVVSNNWIYMGGTYGYGSGICVANGSITLAGCRVVSNKNTHHAIANTSYRYGAGMHADNAMVVIYGSVFQDNSIYASANYSHRMFGSGLSLAACTAAVWDCLFTSNSIRGGPGDTHDYGGGLYLSGGSVGMTNCTWSGNSVYESVSIALGGALFATNVNPLQLSDCRFLGNTVHGSGTLGGGALYLTGPDGVTEIRNGGITNNVLYPATSDGGIWLNDGALRMTHSIFTGNRGGLTSLGVLGLNNCLVAMNVGDGLLVAGGTAALVNVTSADNSGWGIACAAGSVSVTNSIAWANGLGGIVSNANVSVGYSCSQNPVDGPGNLTNDPLLVYGGYLSVSGHYGQAATSPCFGAGSGSAASLGLTNRTTRTDGLNDTHAPVDLGYHYAAAPGFNLTNLALYVDAVNGSNTHSGWGWDAPLQTVSEALARTVPGGTIHVAAGTYSAASGESFPWIPPVGNLTFRGTNAEDTILKGTGADQVFRIIGRGSLWFEGVTIRDGKASAHQRGGGVCLATKSVVFTNCIIATNIANAGNSGARPSYGGGIYFDGHRLALYGGEIRDNQCRHDPLNDGVWYGGGVYATGTEFYAADVVFLRNGFSHSANSGHFFEGGGLHLSFASATFSGCSLVSNAIHSSTATGYGHGGGVYVREAAVFSNCLFQDNYALRSTSPAWGGAVYSAADALVFEDCAFYGNYARTTGAQQGGVLYLASGENVLRGCWAVTNGATFAGDIFLADGSLELNGVLCARNDGNGVVAAGGSLSMVQCSVANNTGWGVFNSGGALDVRNSIFWGNSLGGILNPAAGVAYTDSQDGTPAGPGNFSADPLFVNPAAGDYHLRSTAGSWHGGAWEADARLSPCLDAGDPTSDWALEPKPSGGRVNLGAYGNTAQASRTPRGTVIGVW